MFRNVKKLMAGGMAMGGLIFLGACQSGANHTKNDDTTVSIKILLDSAFYKPRLAKAAQSTNAIFSDTIIFQYNKILVDHLPKNLHYKLLTENEMCAFMAVTKKSSLQFLTLEEFIKTPNGYNIVFGTHCMARSAETTYPSESIDTVCQREKYCNAVLHMSIIKKGNALVESESQIMTY